jgi:hypothetical protein
VGGYPITVTLGSNPNYNVTKTDNTLTVGQKTVTGGITVSNKVYDATVSASIATRTLTGVLGADAVSLSGGTATFGGKTAGTGKTVTATGLGLTGGDAGNYTLASTTATATADITVRTLTVSASGVNKTYDGTTTASVTLSDDRAGSDVLTASYGAAAFADKTVGTGKSVDVSGISISGTDAVNYSLFSATAATTANITQRPLTVTADNKSRAYGAANPDFTATYTGFASGENLGNSGVSGEPSLTTAATTNSPLGNYPIVAAIGTLAAVNYSFNCVNGTLTVTVGPMAQVRVETAANGNGTVVGAQTVMSGSALTVYAIARDAGGNYLRNTNASWSLVNLTDGVVAGDLVGNGANATFTGNLPGSARIQATVGGFSGYSGRLDVMPGARSPTVTANDSGIGTVNWTNPDLVRTSDNQRASAGLSFFNQQSRYLKATAFGFAIPAEAVIAGIAVEIERYGSTSAMVRDNSIRLVKGGTITGANRATSADWPVGSGSEAYASYGGSGDLWDTTWTASDINSANFGVAVSARRASGSPTAFIDHIRVTVYYTLVEPDITVFGNGLVVPNGDLTPTAGDGTDFGAANVDSGAVERTFRISNGGAQNLNLSGSPRVAVSGSAPFSVVSQPSSPVGPNLDTPFTVRFDPNAGGPTQATISIVNDDLDRNPYTFVIQGTGVLSPTVSNNGGASNVGTTGARLNGLVLQGYPTPNAYLYWGETPGALVNEIAKGAQSGAFSADIAGLQANKDYYYRCYVTNSAGADWAPDTATFTTLKPTIGFALAASSGAEAVTHPVIAVNLSATSAIPVTVDYTIAGGTAVPGEDFAAASGTLTFPAGCIGTAVPLTVVDDWTVEPNETVAITLANPSGADAGATMVHAYTIVNDDVLPVVENGPGAPVVTATNALLSGLVSTGNPVPSVRIYWGLTDGGTNAGAWGNAAIECGQQAGAFSNATGRLLTGTQYFYRCFASNAVGTAWATNSAVFLTETPRVEFVEASGSGSESLTNVWIGVALQAEPAMDVTVDYTVVGGTAEGGGVDYSLPYGTLLFKAGQAVTGFAMTVVDDWRFESAETVTVRLVNASQAVIGPRGEYVYTIHDNDAGAPEVDNGFGATAITATSATLRASVVATNSGNPWVTIFWGATDGGENTMAWSNSISMGQRGIGAFEAPVAPLATGLRYYYRCHGSNAGGQAWAPWSESFVPNPPPLTLPIENGGMEVAGPTSADAANWTRSTTTYVERGDYPQTGSKSMNFISEGFGGVPASIVGADSNAFRVSWNGQFANPALGVQANGGIRPGYVLSGSAWTRYCGSVLLPTWTFRYRWWNLDRGAAWMSATLAHQSSTFVELSIANTNPVPVGEVNDRYRPEFEHTAGVNFFKGTFASDNLTIRLSLPRLHLQSDPSDDVDCSNVEVGAFADTELGARNAGGGEGTVLYGAYIASAADLTNAAWNRRAWYLQDSAGGAFTIQSGDTLAATNNAGYQYVRIRFTPPGPGVYTGKVRIATTDPVSHYDGGGTIHGSIVYEEYTLVGEGVARPEIGNGTGATGISTNAVVLNGYLSSTGTAATAVFVAFGDNDGGTLAWNWDRLIEIGERNVGAFATNLTDLAAGLPYYYRCVASNAVGVRWASETVAFTTLAARVEFALPASAGPESLGETNIEVRLSAPAGRDVIVDYAVGGTATGDGVDYVCAAGSVTIPRGALSVMIPVTTIDDALDEADETVVLTLSNPRNALLGGLTTHTFTLADNDAPPAVAFVGAPYTVDEGAGSAAVTVTMTNASGRDVEVTLATSDGTASDGADYRATNTVLRWQAGQTGPRTVTVTLLDDLRHENAETIRVALGTPVNGTVVTPETTITIMDDDPAPTLSVADVSVDEGDTGTTQAVFAVGLSAASGLPVTFRFRTVEGTAAEGVDYVGTNGVLTIPAGATSATVSVTINGDTLYETNETFELLLSDVENATLPVDRGLATILDDDPAPALSIDDVTITEGEAGVTDAVFTVRLSAVSGLPATFRFATTNGTAVAGEDHIATNGLVTIPVGQASATVTVGVLGDTLDENNETFTVLLNDAVNASLVDGAGVCTIMDAGTAGGLTAIRDVSSLGQDVVISVFGRADERRSLIATDLSPTNEWRVVYTIEGSPQYSYFTDAGAATNTSRRFYRSMSEREGVSTTNPTLFAMYAFPSETGKWHKLSVPVDFGASNRLDGTLGRQLARGLGRGSPTVGDLCYVLDASNRWNVCLLDAQGQWAVDSDAGYVRATVAIEPWQGFWLKRRSAGSNTVTVLSGPVHTETETVVMAPAQWRMIAWPFSVAQYESEGAAAEKGWGFAAAGAKRGANFTVADQLYVGEGSAARFYYLNPTGRWCRVGTTTPATNLVFRAGEAYYYYHAGTGFVWTAKECQR